MQGKRKYYKQKTGKKPTEEVKLRRRRRKKSITWEYSKKKPRKSQLKEEAARHPGEASSVKRGKWLRGLVDLQKGATGGKNNQVPRGIYRKLGQGTHDAGERGGGTINQI